jgi:CRP-like cAMP-binding protein
MDFDFAQMFRHEEKVFVVGAGTVIFEEGAAADSFYVLLEGEVDIGVRNRVLRTLKAGEIFGEMALIDARPRRASATARTDCKLIEVDEKRFLFLVTQTPYFALGVMRLMASRLRSMDDTAH